jgi:23S rRNA (cytosine1962-C5)-methyltransferase
MPSVKLKSSREKIIHNKHPWIFSGAVETVNGNPSNGETVEILKSNGEIVGFGSYSPNSQIRVRVLSFNPDEKIDSEFLRKKVKDSISQRLQLIDVEKTNAFRLINAESDGLPGVVVDKYGEFLVCQFLSAGAEYLKKDIVEILIEEFKPVGIYERSDADVRKKENLEPVNGLLFGEEPDDLVEIKDNDIKYFVDIKEGHKTGFYLDQSENRKIFSEFVKDKTVLNCFSYTGGFSIYALKGGAKSVVNVETSGSANEIALKNIRLNELDESKIEFINGDVFKILRKFRDERKNFDVIVLDPPKFAESVSQVTKAGKGYKDINLLAMKLINKDGFLFTFSCSGHVTQDLFQKIVAGAAVDSGREVKIIKQLSQSPDHPVALNFPEGLYLKGLVCHIL